jgi:hypothetical protein
VLQGEAGHENLIEMSVHLLYEIQQVEYKGRLLARIAEKNHVDEYIAHSVFESFLIHTRVLYEFLFEAKRYSTDIRAEDFKEDTEYPKAKLVDDYLKDWARFMTDKRLMHLTTDRLEIAADKHEWEIDRIYGPLHRQFDVAPFLLTP